MNASNAALSVQPPLQEASPGRGTRLLPTASQLREHLPLTSADAQQVAGHRDEVRAVLNGDDDRLLMIVGPCSLHDPEAALEYADRLAELAPQVNDRLLLVMRAYVEKPRTTIGWKGLLYDPHLDGSGDMVEGLTMSRRLMLGIIGRGLPVASEILQPLAASYLDDLLSWAAIGARTSESQIHREMVSGLDLPVGFKNGTDGSATIACDAMRSAAHAHQHFGLTESGHPALVSTAGNPDTHLVLRGGRNGPNYLPDGVAEAAQLLTNQGVAARLIVDCSHANSGKDPLKQPEVLASVVEQRVNGNHSLRGVMLEGHLFEGCQPLQGELRYGVSVTDGCLGWKDTEAAVKAAARRLRC